MKRQLQLTIGQLAEQAGISLRTLHYYEEQGLLAPARQGEGEHRVYDWVQVERLQQIMALKFLGFSLKEIRDVLHTNMAAEQWQEMLQQLENQLIRKKAGLEQALEALGRIRLLSDTAGPDQLKTLLSLVSGIQSVSDQREWLEQARGKEAVAAVFKHGPQEMEAMDRHFLHFVQEVKARSGGPADTPEVLELVEQYMDQQLKFVGEEAIQLLGNVEELDVSQLEKMAIGASPFTPQEEEWLQRAMEAAMKKRIALAHG